MWECLNFPHKVFLDPEGIVRKQTLNRIDALKEILKMRLT